ncbi:uracil-DNA glycosylase [Bacillus sp. B1-b2]|uniref:uracil-DNA glycosylase n=1 Tax=Bacillus sp. B1-b2 TaxID=2653201 RepID=UPI001261C3FB|nr:uracil-DNA glycosylase [Bacillus sp. B1-b2]KAB7670631.1 uracil-DNA glycosylase [Bacillus sp. B1-b2]
MISTWEELLEQEKQKDYYIQLDSFLEEEYRSNTIYPKREEIFTSLKWTPYEKVKVVILGQDPYHGPNQAHGLSFSVKPEVKVPPSLKNIYKELHHDLGCPIPNHGYLKSWAEQGVLMLNTVLTVQAGKANSHRGMGWETFTNEVINFLNQREEPIIFVLWGNPAQKKLALIDKEKHGIILSTHPSPLSAHRGFLGSRPFSTINRLLEDSGQSPINWCIDDFS